MTKYIFLAIFLILCKFNYGQQIEQEFPKVVTPETYNFVKYGDIPVGESTGNIGLSIPIYTIEQDGLQFPVRLTYHSGGHRITDEASWVGLGWNLQLGSIVQMVQDQNDLEFPLYLPDYHSSATIIPMTEAGAGSGSQPLSSPYYGFYSFWDYLYPVNGSMVHWGNYLNAPYPNIDLEPDIFIANFNENSIQFIIDPENDNNFIVLNKKGYKVGKSPDDGWIITTSNGIRYYFDEINQSDVASSNIGYRTYQEYFPNADFASEIQGGGVGTVSTSNIWQLTKIITKVGREINFYYTEKQPITNTSLSYQWDLSKVLNIMPNPNPAEYGPIEFLTGSFSDLQIGKDYVSCNRTVTSSETSYIGSIEFMDGNAKLEFDLSERLDIFNARKLDLISLLYNESNIKTFNFNYDYFISDYVGCGWITARPQTELTHRLKLESIQETGKPPYEFLYNSIMLPPKNSFAQDYWGFYNGMLQNNSILPNVNRLRYSNDIYLNLPDYFEDLVAYNTTNNSADPVYAKASILERIIYPTGGKSVFDYELNTYDNQILPDKNYGAITEQINATCTNLTTDINTTRKGFFIPSYSCNTNGSCIVSLTSGPLCNFNDVYARIYSLDISVKADYINNTTAFWNNFYANVYPKQLVFERILSSEVQSVYETFNLTLSPTKFYVAIVHCDANCNGFPSNTANLQIRFSYLPPFNQTFTSGNGLRIKTLTNYSDSKFVNRKQYSYYGGKIALPGLFYKNWGISDFKISEYNSPIKKYSYNIFQFQTSNFISVNPLGAGNSVGYNKVVIEDVNEQDIANGKVEKYFTNTVDDYLASSPLTYKWGISLPSYRLGKDNGLLYKELIYDNDNQLKQKTEYDYFYKRYNEFYGARYKFLGKYFETLYTHDWGMFSFYPIFKTESFVEKKTTTSILEGQEVVKVEDYVYTEDNLLRSQSFKNSNDEILSTTYYYPDDAYSIGELSGSERDIINQLNKHNQHRISELIKTSSYNNSNVTKKVLRIYDVFEGNTLPASIRVAYKTGEFQDKVVYDKYDENGNILQYHKEDDIYSSVVWGYNDLFPLAILENIEYNSIPSDVKSKILQLDDNLPINELNSVNEQIRTDIPNDVFISTYTYEPLIGIITETDPNNKTDYYEYDEFGRLKNIKDDDENIISNYQYNYGHIDPYQIEGDMSIDFNCSTTLNVSGGPAGANETDWNWFKSQDCSSNYLGNGFSKNTDNLAYNTYFSLRYGDNGECVSCLVDVSDYEISLTNNSPIYTDCNGGTFPGRQIVVNGCLDYSVVVEYFEGNNFINYDLTNNSIVITCHSNPYCSERSARIKILYFGLVVDYIDVFQESRLDVISLNVTNNTSYFFVDVDEMCGGYAPYTFNWEVIINYGQHLYYNDYPPLTLDRLAGRRYEVKCTVTDSKGQQDISPAIIFSHY